MRSLNKRRCCPCGRKTSPSPESPRIVGSHPLQRTGIRNEDSIASQIYDPVYAEYFNRKAHEARTAQALGMIGQNVLGPERSLTYMPPDILDYIESYANQRGGKRRTMAHSYKKKLSKKPKIKNKKTKKTKNKK